MPLSKIVTGLPAGASISSRPAATTTGQAAAGAGAGGPLMTTGGVNIATSTPLSISNPIKIKAPRFEKGGGLLAGAAIQPAGNQMHGPLG